MKIKVSDVVDEDEYRPVRYGRTFIRERVADAERLRIGYDDVPDGCVQVLASRLSGPFQLLYVLHTTRTGAELGRYQSPELSSRDLADFFRAFGRFIAEDSRHDLWVRSHGEPATIVLDRHNIIFAYGPLDLFQQTLVKNGAVAGDGPPTVGYPRASLPRGLG